MNFHTTSFRVPNRRAVVREIGHEVKLHMIETLLVEYPGFRSGTATLARFHIRSNKLMLEGRGSIGGVIGEFRSGKSFLVKNYIQRFVPIEDKGGMSYPVLYVNARKEWDGKELARQVMRKTNRPPRSTGSISDINTLALERMNMLAVKLFVIDDAHALLMRAATATSFFSFIQAAVESRTCNILLVGPDVVKKAIDERPELKGRGNFPHAVVKSFKPVTKGGENTYRLFLEAVDDRLPFPERSMLWTSPFFEDLVKFSRGSIAETVELIQAAAYLALDDDADRIEYHHFTTAMNDRLGLVSAEEFAV